MVSTSRRVDCARSIQSVTSRVRLEYCRSLRRLATPIMVSGTGPTALHRSTWNTSVSRRGVLSST